MVRNGITIRVETQQLKDILTDNKAKHAESYRLALEGYVDAVKDELTEKLARLNEGKRVEPYSKHREPESHLSDYDDLIGMLSLAMDDMIELDQQEYRQYVNDDWAWKQSWLASNSGYTEAALAR